MAGRGRRAGRRVLGGCPDGRRATIARSDAGDAHAQHPCRGGPGAGAAAGRGAADHADGRPGVHAVAADRRHRRVPVLPGRPRAAAAGPSSPAASSCRRTPAIVHHAIFYRVPEADVAGARGLDRADPGDGWTCFGGTGVGGSAGRQRPAARTGWPPGHRAAASGGRRPAPATCCRPAASWSCRCTTTCCERRPAPPTGPAIRLRLRDGDGAGSCRCGPRCCRRRSSCPARPASPARSATGRRPSSTSSSRFGADAGATVAGLDSALPAGRAAGGRPHPALRPPGRRGRPDLRGRRAHAPARHRDQGGAQPGHAAGSDLARRPAVQLRRPAAPCRCRGRSRSAPATRTG